MDTSEIAKNRRFPWGLVIVTLILLAGGYVWWLETKKEEGNVLPPVDRGVTESIVPPSFKETKEEIKSVFGIANYFDKKYDGREFTTGRVLESNSAYTRYFITYKSGELTISGIMNVPKGTIPEGGFPVLILNHGFIDQSIYTNGRGLKREQDYLARKGFVVIHPDYRNHAESTKTDDDAIKERLGYVEDVINLVYAVRASDLSYVNKEKIGMMGHSMGGGISQTIAVVQPDLVKAMVLYAPVSMDLRDSYERWMKERPETVSAIAKLYGLPVDNPDFWDSISAERYTDRIAIPMAYHHGTKDPDVPIEWSDQTVGLLQSKNKTVEYFKYEGEGHEFGPQWNLFMQRTADFFHKQFGG